MFTIKNSIRETIKTIALLLVIQNTLFAEDIRNYDHNHTDKRDQTEMLFMDSIGEVGVILLVILTSTIGSFFLRE